MGFNFDDDRIDDPPRLKWVTPQSPSLARPIAYVLSCESIPLPRGVVDPLADLVGYVCVSPSLETLADDFRLSWEELERRLAWRAIDSRSLTGFEANTWYPEPLGVYTALVAPFKRGAPRPVRCPVGDCEDPAEGGEYCRFHRERCA